MTKAEQRLINMALERGGTVGPVARISAPIPKAKTARHSHDQNRMNKLEAAYAVHLQGMVTTGHYIWWAWEPIKFKLAHRTFYTPDFMVMTKSGGLEIHEVKGFWEEDARVKWKAVAEKYPMFTFVAVTKIKGQWEFEVYRQTKGARQ